ncbi:MinD/ParA family protein [Spirulina subsalsa FACHB-351]|uniref:MinD/ParA family protein n=1 Tax=Spirulina subsalsa FACHB-351 TaxID=234711 RepID=A0ABT3LA40_9CYAN|nr:MinD/ParA family protein [Spirulina subsalsa]MCW6037840.1 MinD/ParA family protein [Spirulina subsalsa FACHB-351]
MTKSKRPKVVSIHSYRGGTGKSNSTANLAVTIASYGHRVAIVDTDIQSPGIHVLFGYGEENLSPCLNDYLWGRCKLSAAAHEMTNVLKGQEDKGGKVFLVPSSIKAGDIARVLREGYDVGLLNDGFQDLMEDLDLDYLLIDTHPGLNEETLLSITISDVLLLILRPDQQDFQGTAVTVDVARRLEVPKMLMMVNKAPTLFDFDELKRKVESIYEVPVAGILPHSDDVMMLASNGVFVVNYPEHEVTETIRAIAQQIML